MTPSASPHLGDILNRLDGVKQSGKGYVALCPAHEDRHHSLSISEDRGKILLHCHTGCTPQAIVGALGLPMTALFQDKTKASGNGHKATTETTWQIKDASGKVVAEHVRVDHEDGSKSFVWRRDGKTGLNGTKTEALPLYGLPLLLESPSGVHVVVTEGEKAADSLQRRGFVAVGTVTGAAGCPSEESLSCLVGFTNVYLWPDGDEPGRKHMDKVGARLAVMGRRPLIINWPDAPLHGDAADYTGDVRALLDAAQPWQPSKPEGIKATVPDGAVSKEIILADGSSLVLIGENVRRERTGIHSKVSILLDGTCLASDLFNVERDGERGKLARSAAEHFPEEFKKSYTGKALKLDLDRFCGDLFGQSLEQLRGGPMAGKWTPVKLICEELGIIEGGGTILGNLPGTGKSFVAIIAAILVDSGIDSGFMKVRRARVAYLNLERSRSSQERRLAQANVALGLSPDRPLIFVNARGRSLWEVEDVVRNTIEHYGVEVLILDSISRAGMGSMVEDTSANRTIDILNRLCPTWLALAHTPRADSSHVYGSIMFDAGADVVLRMASQERNNQLGIGLQIVKSNDVPKGGLKRLALQFNDAGLCGIRHARPYEFPEIEIKKADSVLDQMECYLSEVEESSASEMSRSLGIPRTTIASTLANNRRFVATRKDGRSQLYGLRAEEGHAN